MPFKKFRTTSPNWVGFLALSLLLFSGCSGNKGDSGKTHAMGEAALTGNLTYHVVETEWRQSLDGSMGQRLPKNQFLLVNITVANGGDAEVGVPFLSLVDAKGAEFREEVKGDGVAQWLGYLRRLGPTETLSGKVLFDVPPGGYKLRISSGGAADTETTALVELPYRADASPVKAVEPIPVPSDK